jgi:hypothetical protein
MRIRYAKNHRRPAVSKPPERSGREPEPRQASSASHVGAIVQVTAR